MVARQALCAFRVPGLQGVDDPHVILQRTLGPVHLENRAVTDRFQVQRQIFRHGGKGFRPAEADQSLVKGDVGRGVFIEMIEQLMVLAEALKKGAQRSDAIIARMKCDQTRRHAFERGPNLDHLDDLALRPAHHHDASTRGYSNETLLLEHGHGFADRGSADSKTFRQFAFIQHHRSGRPIDVHVGDGLLQGGVSFRLEAYLFGKASNHKLAVPPVWPTAQLCWLKKSIHTKAPSRRKHYDSLGIPNTYWHARYLMSTPLPNAAGARTMILKTEQEPQNGQERAAQTRCARACTRVSSVASNCGRLAFQHGREAISCSRRPFPRWAFPATCGGLLPSAYGICGAPITRSPPCGWIETGETAQPP